jgi:hypothetical protein
MATTALHPTGVTGVPYSFTAKTAASGQTVSVPTVTFTLDAGLPLGVGVGVPVVTFQMELDMSIGTGVPVVEFTLSPDTVTSSQTSGALQQQAFSTYDASGMREHLRRARGGVAEQNKERNDGRES